MERSKEDQSRVELGMSMRVILVGVCAVTAPLCARERVLVFTVSAELFPFPKKPVEKTLRPWPNSNPLCSRVHSDNFPPNHPNVDGNKKRSASADLSCALVSFIAVRSQRKLEFGCHPKEV